jgi:uncharacterized cupin superfamily protein
MAQEARLEEVDSGLTPATEAWFVVNVRHAAWLTGDGFGARCGFETDAPLVRERPELEVRRFPEVGIKLAVIEPGRQSTLHHAESSQEDFLVLQGEFLLLVEREGRRLRAWDFVHCPPGTAHSFVGAGAEPCVLLMVDAPGERSIVYPVSDLALHGAGVEAGSDCPLEACATYPHWQPDRPHGWERLPWA